MVVSGVSTTKRVIGPSTLTYPLPIRDSRLTCERELVAGDGVSLEETPVDLRNVVTNVVEVETGLWAANDQESSLSYPESGHRSMAEVEDDSYWFRHRAQVLVSVFERYPPAGCVFDIGGGNGYMVRAIRESGHDSVLIEPGIDGCRTALRRGLAPVLNGTTDGLGVRPRSLASVGLFDVVEHIEDDRGFLGHVRDLMEPGGSVYLTVPAHQSLWSANDVSAGHYRRYSRSEISHLLTGVGLEVVYSTYMFRSLLLPVFLLRSVPYRLGVGESKANTTDVHHLPSGAAGRWMGSSMAREVQTIRAGGSIRSGTSVFAVAVESK